MRVRGKKLLAAMLSLAMVLSMFVVPAAAAEIGKEWTLQSDDFSAAVGDGEYDGLTFSNAGYNGGYGMALNGGGTVTVPVPGACNIKLVVGYSWNLTLGDENAKAASDAGHNKVVIFHHNSAEPAVITSTGSSYIKSIKLETYTEPTYASVGDSWDFRTLTKEDGGNYTQGDALAATLDGYDGLILNSPKYHGTTYGVSMGNGDMINIAVDGDCDIKVSVGYKWSIKLGDDGEVKSGSSSDPDLVFHYTGGKGIATLRATGETYVKAITLAGPVSENKLYKFSTKAGAADDAAAKAEYNDPSLMWNGFNHNNGQHGPDNGSSTGTLSFRIPDGKKTTLTLTTCCYGNGVGNITVTGGSLSSTVTDTSEVDGNAGKVFTINNAKGEVTITFASKVYVHSLEVGAFTDASAEPDPSLELDKSEVTVKVDDAATKTATVTATVEDAPDGTEVQAVSNDSTIATAAVSGNTITITAVAAGNTTVKVSLKDVENSPEKTIAVWVKPAGDEYIAPGKYTFGTKGHDGVATASHADYTKVLGLDFNKFNPHNGGHGPVGGNGSSITVHLPEDKGYYTLTVTTCSSGKGVPVKLNEDETALSGETVSGNNNGDGGDKYVISNVKGDTVIHFGSTVYFHGLTVSEPVAEAATTLTLDKVRVELKLDETETATVTATVENSTAAVKAVSSDNTVATATVADKVITITAKKEGNATVTVSLDGVAGLEKTVNVVVKPAGAEIAAPGKHVFGTKGHDGSTTINRPGTDGFKEIIGIDWGTFVKHADDHGLRGSGAITIHLPEDKYSTIVITTCHYGNGGDVTATGGDKVSVSFEPAVEADGNNGKVWTISNAKGDTTITFPSQAYVHGLTVGEFSDEPVTPPATLTLSKSEVTLKLDGKTSETVTATVENSDAAVKAVSSKPSVATAEVTGNTITIEAIAEGEATVTVTLDGMVSPKKTIKVYVDPAGEIADIMAEGIIYFDQLRNADFASINFARIRGFEAPNFTVGNEHGIAGTGDITIKMAKKGSITVQGCTYGAGKNLVMTSSSGTVEKEIVSANNGESDTALFFVTGAEGDTVLTFSGNGTAYIHYIMVEYDFEITDRNFDVWDFSGKAVSGENYNNNITPALWVESGKVANGVFTSNGDLAFGDLTISHQLNDRLYSQETGLGSIANTSGDYTGWYCNGEGKKDTSRCITIAHVAAGDKIVAYIGGHNGDVTYHFQGVGPASAQDDTKVQGSASAPCVFVAQYSGTYKIWGEGGNKPLYQRIERYRGVNVSGSITLPDGFDATEYTVKFINQDNDQVTLATLDGTDFTVTLAPGFKYVASLSGASGWGFTKDSRFVTTTTDETLTGKDGVELVVDVKPLYTYSGTISGFAAGYDVSELAITMIPDKAAVANGAERVELTLDGLDFTAKLDPDNVTYTLEMTGVNDYAITAPAQVRSTGDDLTGQTISVEAKALQTASGKFLGLTGDATVTALSFENVDDGYTYPATVTANGYTANLRAGAYAAVATVAGHSTKSHVVVIEGRDTVKDLLFVSTAAKPAVAWAKDVYVDPAKVGQANTYATIREAVDAVSRMGVSSEAKRVTIHIAPGTYREQVIIDTPYITLTNDKAGEVLLTWYYGIGYKYYSSNGYYDEELAYDKFAKGIADRWGTTVRVNSGATAFRAEGITFENSFNRYVTAEEIADGVEPAGNEKIDLVRTLKMDVSTNAATERAAAMCVEAGQAEFFNCTFLSSQDTLYTNGKVYFKNCFIEGQTDYIYGDVNSKCVFDECTLSWKGYSANSKGGYITALRTNEGDVGYLFRDCTVAANSKLTVTPGYFGRPWGPKAGVFFLNTKLEKADLINPVGWYEMSGNQPEDAQYKEFGTTTLDGKAVDTASRIPGTVATQAQANAVKVTDYFGDWTPYYYGIETHTVTFKVDSGASVTDLAEDGEARVLDSNNKLLALKDTVITFKIGLSKSHILRDVTGATWDDNGVYTVTGDTVVIKVTAPSSGMVPTGPSGGSTANKVETVTNPDGSKTTTTTDKKGNTIVTTVAPDGSKVETVTTKDGDKTITVTDAKGEVQVKIELPATIPAPETKFTDVPENHWAEGAINDMAGLGLVKGVSNDIFDMDSPITRASVATILFRLSNGAKGKTSSFTDIKAGEWYADAVAWAASTGVVNGYSETIFAPDESITREQFAVMLYRFAKLIRMDTTASGDVSKFSDAVSVSNWAADAMAWCVGKGILNGTNDPVQGIALSPAKTASRAECAVMLGRFIALI